VQTQGSYRIRMEGYISGVFRIGDDIIEDAVWKLVNFLFSERCGYPLPGKHGTCHGDVVARHNGLTMAFQGGWHDAADVSQETVQTAETAHALMSVARSVKSSSPVLASRLMEEANWGLDFVLRTRLGGGWRASGSALRRWTDGLVGNMDDVEAHMQNNSFINFQIAAIEVDMSLAFAGSDSELAWKCLDAAKEDFYFAEKRFSEVGVEPLYIMEHATGSSLSQYYAAACWAAALLCQTAGGEEYQHAVKKYAGKLVACQENGAANLPMKGFFYLWFLPEFMKCVKLTIKRHFAAFTKTGWCLKKNARIILSSWKRLFRWAVAAISSAFRFVSLFGATRVYCFLWVRRRLFWDVILTMIPLMRLHVSRSTGRWEKPLRAIVGVWRGQPLWPAVYGAAWRSIRRDDRWCANLCQRRPALLAAGQHRHLPRGVDHAANTLAVDCRRPYGVTVQAPVTLQIDKMRFSGYSIKNE